MNTKPRRPLVALFAALLLPGLGQIYCGEIARGATFLLSLALILPLAAWLGLHAPRALLTPMIVLGVLTALALYVYSIVAAIRSARRLGEGFSPGPCNHGHAYVALFLLGHLFVMGPLAEYTKKNLVETFKVPSQSMLPTIMPGDRLFADKRVGQPGGASVRRGDIAVFVYPNDRTTLYLKRIVGLPGDKIDIDGTSVKVNGNELRQEELHDLGNASLNRRLADHVAFHEAIDGASYAVFWRKGEERKQVSLTVPNGQAFVLGDNRPASQDSRAFGTLPLADVTAVARQIWFSTNPEDGVRWWRVGKQLD